MDGNMEISVDKLPIKRLESIEENGAERFPNEVGYEERRLNLIHRIDFGWAVDREDSAKKHKKDTSATTTTSKDATKPWPWKSLVENLQAAHQELSVIIDLINTVEVNDAVTVAGMTRPKQLPNELLSDLAVSTATKLQCYRHLGKYFKQSAKGLEQQIAREARFYGALIRLQQNWKVKRHRMAATPGNEGFYIDLFDNSLYDPAASFRPSTMSTVWVEHDAAGMLAINLPQKAVRSLQFGFLCRNSDTAAIQASRIKAVGSDQDPAGECKKEPESDDDCVKNKHAILREVHRAIFDEQVFDLVNREAFNPSLGVNITGIRENYLELNLSQGASVFISLMPHKHEDRVADSADNQNSESALVRSEFFNDSNAKDRTKDPRKKSVFPNRVSCEIFLQQTFHEHVFVQAKKRTTSGGKMHSGQPTIDRSNLLGHFCMSLAHRIFSNKILRELDDLVSRVPYVHLISHPTWNSRTSSWTLSVDVPQSIIYASCQTQKSDKKAKTQFRTKVLVNDCIKVEGEGAPNVVGLFKGTSERICSINRYDCDLADLPMILLQQIASQIIRWLHAEALMVGIKANRDFLCLSFELEQGETLGLVAHVNPEDPLGCISWWLVMDDGFTEEGKLQSQISDTHNRKFLGHLSLDVLYSTLLDLVSLCSGGSNH
ncbi:hypothetical protein DCAR_0415963 [Daucus carota subsp. sativus]|uniref:Mediator of RNA polymerase II transcription subunit 17 n=1 Tax=Daucus carota subsp. sativus TaxID=79200 RepID=A0AAF0WVM0_DAUCS|nr:PREDICTED: mediator of RNA polymerase II transcription subunit 17 [Daucus carota subsp. sativus]WOG96627.1 hypothetical protein DCAR_0415963 [Daucus carota subsp. sativus]